MTAVAIPFGMAAALAFQAPAASATTAKPAASAAAVTSVASGAAVAAAAPAENSRQILAARLLAVSQPAAANYGKSIRLRAYRWAARRAGHPYVYGGTGPGFDCSGLVMMAYRHAGIHLPRTTYQMLASPLLVRVARPRMGDLAFYGSGHVELFRKWGWTFGAHDYGSPVGLIHYGWGWKPTAFYRIRIRAVRASSDF